MGTKRLRKALSVGREAHMIATSISTVLRAKGGFRVSESEDEREKWGMRWGWEEEEGGLPYDINLEFGTVDVGEIRVVVESMEQECET